LFPDTFSEVGRSTAGQLENLRRQLGVGIDPAYDYSKMTELQRKLTSKKRQPAKDDFSAGGAIDQLRQALKEATEPPPVEEQEEETSAAGSPTKAGAGASDKKSPDKPSWAFRTRDRNSLQALDVANRFRAPPPGSYRAKHELCDPRVKGNHDFRMRTPTKSRSAVALEREVARLQEDGEEWEHLVKPVTSVELLDEAPDKLRRRKVVYDWGKLVGRPDLVKSANIQYNDNSFTAGISQAYDFLSNSTRQSCHDFAKQSTAPEKLQETFFQPGQYKVNDAFTRAKLEVKNIPFDKQTKRKPLRETIGRVEIKSRAGDHLPDRSLARSCPFLDRRLKIPNFDKYSDRPPPAVAKKPNHDASNPEVDRVVFHREMTHDEMGAAKATWSKAREAEKFDKSLDRQSHFRMQRQYADNILFKMAKENSTRGLTSLDMLPAGALHESQQLNPRVLVRDFERMPTREVQKKHAESPPRNKIQSEGMRFARSTRSGDARAHAEVLSPSAAEIMHMRSARGVCSMPLDEM